MSKLEVVSNVVSVLGDMRVSLVDAGTVFFADDIVSREGNQRLGKGLYYRVTFDTVVNLGSHHAYTHVSAHTIVGFQAVTKAVLTLT